MSVVDKSEYSETPIGRLPSTWSVSPFGSLLAEKPEYGANASAESFNDGYVRYIRITDIDDAGRLIPTNSKYLPPEEAKNYLLIDNDIVIARTGNTVGKSLRYRSYMGPCAFAGYLIRFRVGPSLCPEFASQYIRSDTYWSWVKSSVKVGAQPNINSQQYQALPLPVPPLPEQQKIAAILTAVDDKLDVIARQIEATQTLKQGLMQTLFSRGVGTQDADGRWEPHTEFKDSALGEIPTEWAVERIDTIASINPTRTKIDDESLDVTFLGMADISEDGKLIRQHTKAYAEVSKGFTSFVDNDVLVAKITPCFENGKGALVDGLANGIGFGSTEFHVIRADTKILDVRFIHAHTRTRKFRLLGERNMVGSAGQKRVPTEFIKSFLIAVPSLGEQQKIADILDAVDVKAENLIAKHTHYQTLKRGLMQKLLTGEWRVNVDASASGN